MGDKLEWDPAAPSRQQRILAGSLGVLILVTSASYFLELRLFGDHDGQVMGGVICFGTIIVVRFLPGVRRA